MLSVSPAMSQSVGVSWAERAPWHLQGLPLVITDPGYGMVVFTPFRFCVFLLAGLHVHVSRLVAPLFNV